MLMTMIPGIPLLSGLREGIQEPSIGMGASQNEGPKHQPEIVGLLYKNTYSKDQQFVETAICLCDPWSPHSPSNCQGSEASSGRFLS